MPTRSSYLEWNDTLLTPANISTYPNLTSLEKDLNLARLISDKFSGNENNIIGGSGNISSDEGLNSVLLAITSEKIFSNYRGKNPLDGSHLC